jgi:DNA-binding LacI/PurR family transcriptional regulator
MGSVHEVRATVGVLVDWFKDSYQSTVLAGLSDAALRGNTNLVIFAGGVLGAPAADGLDRNFVFDLPGPRNVDGMVVLGCALSNQLGTAAVEALVSRWSPMPLASVALALPGIPSVLLDEAPGMRQALEHLVARHGCRRIAFIRGPAVNAEAERRYAIYRTVLADHGIELDPRLVCEGTFLPVSGAAAVATLVDERKVDFDAVVASNDYMALAAIAAIQERGVQVPSDVAVVGFDDLEETRYSTPPLTTVRQPVRQNGETGLELVLAQLEGREAPAETIGATELVTRQSCGCVSGLARAGRAGPVTPTPTGIESLLREHAGALRDQMAQAVQGAAATLDAGWNRRLLEALEAELRGAGVGLFANTLDGLLGSLVTAGEDVAAWQGMVSTLRRLLLPALANEPLRLVAAEDIWHEARILISDLAERAQAQQRLRAQTLARALHESSTALRATQDMPALVAALAAQLPRLGIPGCWLALFEGREGAARTRARLTLAWRDGAPIAADGGGGDRVFDVAELVPRDALPANRRFTLVVEPLYFRGEPFGFLVLERGPREGIVYEALGEQVSNALQRIRLAAAV